MVSPPQSSNAMCRSGTPVSLMSMTSKRQQQAWQFEQETSVSLRFLTAMVIDAFMRASEK